MIAPAKLSTKAAMPTSASAIWIQIHALPSAGASVTGRATDDLRLKTTTTGSTNAPSTVTPDCRSTSISSNTTTQTTTDTALGNVPSGGPPISIASTTSASVWAIQPTSVASTARRWTYAWRWTRCASASPMAQTYAMIAMFCRYGCMTTKTSIAPGVYHIPDGLSGISPSGRGRATLAAACEVPLGGRRGRGGARPNPPAVAGRRSSAPDGPAL